MSHEYNTEFAKHEEINWKQLYLQEVQNYLELKQKYCSLYQDIKYHIEYNQLIENKLVTLENEYFHLLEDHHKKLVENRMENLKASLNYVDSLKEILPEINIDNFKDKIILNSLNHQILCEQNINDDLRNQINTLIKDKEDLQRELLLTKSQLLEFSEKLEEETEKNISLSNMKKNNA